MPKAPFPLAILFALVSATVFAAPEASEVADGAVDSAACALQDNGECLKALETRAAAAAKPRSRDEGRLFAVLVNGDTSVLHNRNVERAYEVLKTLGTPDENIYILSNSNPRPAAADSSLVTARATTGNLSNVLYYLSGEVDRDDCVVLYTTGHGDQRRGQSTLCMNDGFVYEKDLVKQLKAIEPASVAVVMDQCFSGGFVDAFERADMDVLAMADTDGDHETYCEYFAAAFWFGLLEPAADIDSDGRISFNESYEVAMEIHRLALADTPERTQGRVLGAERQVVPAVALDQNMLIWAVDEKPAESKAKPILQASIDVPRTSPARRDWSERHRPDFRPH